MKNDKAVVNKKGLQKLLDYLEKDEYQHYMSYESPRPKGHIYLTIKNLKEEVSN
jgi:hypothetical protein